MNLVNVRDASGKLHQNITFARVPVVGELVKNIGGYAKGLGIVTHFLDLAGQFP